MTAKEIKRTLQSEFVRTLRKPFVDAVKAYGLVKPSDKVAVCISGGKDSMLLALLLQDLQHTVDFDLVFLAMDPGYAPEGRKHLEENAKRLDIPLEIFDTDVLRVAGVHSAEHPCFLCAKMRRGALNDVLLSLGCNKIALGHHFDDAVETFLMSLLYEGRIGCFEPVTYLSRTGITQIRPMLYVGEQAIAHFAERYELPVVHNVCPADKHTKRQEVKELIVTLQAQYPDLKSKVFGAMQRLPLPKWGPEEK